MLGNIPFPATEEICVMSEYLETRAQSMGGFAGEGLLSRLWNNWKARRDITNLQRLDDHMLKDIGLSRADIFWASQQSLDVNAALVLEERGMEQRFR
jgi:uncharacterized protein YjiS (DUF1127 family)